MAPRIRLLRLILVLVLLVVAGRLVQIQVMESPHYQAAARGELTQTVTVPALRGGIFDRNGAPLALSIPTKTVVADDFQVLHPVTEAQQLAPMLGVPAGTLAHELHLHSGYVPLVKNLSNAKAARVAAMNLPGITMLDNSYRVDPDGQLAQSILGGTNASEKGSGGLEYQYQKLLAGTPGREQLVESTGGVVLPQSGATQLVPGEAGTGIELTLDAGLQYQTEQALAAAITSTHAINGTAVVMDVKTGQVLSMANLMATPTGSVSQATSNLAVTQTYEPGSVFKLVTFSGALQDGIIDPNKTFSVPSSLSLDGSTFHDAEPHGDETLTATQILAESSNIGTSEIAQALGEGRLLSQIQNLGFGQKTGLDFPGESGGIVLGASQWEPTDYVDMPIGQVDATTAMQVLDMMNSVANGGVMVQPKLVQAKVASDGSVKATAPSASRQVMSTSTASQLNNMLQQVVIQGTGTTASIPGYDVAGKTGTASIPDPVHGGYIPNAYMASFAGFAPADHPVFSAIVVLNQPTPAYGGTVAAPVFSQVVGYALHHYGIPTSPGAGTTSPPPATGNNPSQDVT